MRNTIFLLLTCINVLWGQSPPNYSAYGVFNVNRTQYYDVSNTSLITDNSVAAYFTYTSSDNISFDDCDSAGIVQFNGGDLFYDDDLRFYANNSVSNIGTQGWTVSGKNQIPGMNFVYSGSMPAFDVGNNLINDTLVKSDTLFVTLNNIQNTDSINIVFWDDLQGASINKAVFKAPNYTNSYYIVPSVYDDLQTGSRACIKIEAINYSYQTISGKQFLFRNIYGFARNNISIVN